MILFLSDLHLGRGTHAESRAAEDDACALLDAHAAQLADDHGALVLVGDVFDAYMEYRHLVPKGAVRLQGRLAALVDAGVPVTYVVGNRDPWHLDYFAQEIGVRLVRDHAAVAFPVGRGGDGIAPWRVYIAHGDGRIAHDRLYNRIRPFMHHPAVARLYRMLLPGDVGYAFARWTGRRAAQPLGRDRTGPDLPAVTALRRFAHQTLASTDADLVVCGHVHLGECSAWDAGTYLNPGYWFGHRTFGRLDADGPALLHWDGRTAHPCRVCIDADAFVIERALYAAALPTGTVSD